MESARYVADAELEVLATDSARRPHKQRPREASRRQSWRRALAHPHVACLDAISRCTVAPVHQKTLMTLPATTSSSCAGGRPTELSAEKPNMRRRICMAISVLLGAAVILGRGTLREWTESGELNLVTWNIAAINNNPFEYWITHEDADYNKLMIDVQEFISSPGTRDVPVGDVFTPAMWAELKQEMSTRGWSGAGGGGGAVDVGLSQASDHLGLHEGQGIGREAIGVDARPHHQHDQPRVRRRRQSADGHQLL